MAASSSAVRRPQGAAVLGGVNVGSLLLLLSGTFAVFAALLARHGFTGRDHVVGIDLGTTYSVVAISQKNNVTAIADKEGHVLVPSTVAFLPNGGVLVGREARAYRTTDPQHTIFNAKRFIGQSYEDVLTSEADENGVSPYEFGVKMLQDNEHDGVCFTLALQGQRGTLDVSLLFARNGAISVLDTLGDNHLGGEDLDARLSAWLLKEFEAQLGTAIKSRRTETEEKTLDDDSREPPCTMTGVRQAAELVKRQLTDASVTTAACVWKDSKKLVRAEVKVTRTQFEELCGSLLERTMIPVREVLEANNMDTDEIDAVVLGRAPLSDIDPDLAVAYGAARTLD
ncbi:hypothetical protein PC120_g24929 [Phytophthora cactorum]|nr:hypothetical protein PC120_g24929 [Phytophthora cactorum]KAG3053176.1 hypothetical protein PC122_g22418 [Phytophthora cactorum]